MLATALLIGATLGGYGLSVLSVRNGLFYEEIINICGRQRMLSQRIVLLANKYAITGSAEYLETLRADISTFSDAHSWLLQQVKEDTPIFAHYYGPGGVDLDSETRRFLALANGFLTHSAAGDASAAQEALQGMERMAIGPLLADLNQAVTLFEEAANLRSATREKLRAATIAAVLALVAAKALFIFYPAHRQLTGMIARFQNQAQIDSLTGLSNRRHFLAEAQKQMLAHADDLGQIFVLALDLDGFIQINDTLGHPAGDVVLRTIAARLQALHLDVGKGMDIVLARPGGDEFLVLGCVKQGATLEVARAFADSIIEVIERPIEVSPPEDETPECIVGVSVGIADGRSSGGVVDALVANADIALYESKRQGKGVATVFDETMRFEAERRNQWRDEVADALQELDFLPYFQPQVEISTGRVVGLEALARWRHPKLGVIEPAHFAEQVELVRKTDALDGQIILRAVEAMRHCRELGLFVDRMSVNASSSSLRDPNFATALAMIIESNGLSPEDFAVEILEKVIREISPDEAAAAVERLKSAGFAVAVDDFGSASSSLDSMVSISGSVLKLHKSLVAQMDDPTAHRILEAAIGVGHGLKAQICAEGVELPEHLMRLRRLGVDVVQGVVICDPMGLDDLIEWLGALPPDLPPSGQTVGRAVEMDWSREDTLPFGPPGQGARAA